MREIVTAIVVESVLVVVSTETEVVRGIVTMITLEKGQEVGNIGIDRLETKGKFNSSCQ